MFKQSIWMGLLILLMGTPVSREKGVKEEMERDMKSYMFTKDYCSMDELEELNYYLFCDTQLHEGAGGFTFKQSIIGSETQTIEEAKELYKEFMERLPLEPEKEGEENDVFYDGGYDDFKKINVEGNLLARIQDNYSLLTIREIEDGSEQWSFSLQGIREEVERIRDDMQEGDTVSVIIQQFEGNEKEGWLTVQAGLSSFFRIAYPSGEVSYLGEYMYSVCFSPDGKYAAYSSVDYDNGVVMENEKYDEYERLERICPPGIYVREIGTGKTAYIYWDLDRNPEEDYMEYRHFMWIEKESFEKYMEEP